MQLRQNSLAKPLFTRKKDGYYTFATVITFTYENNEQIINGNAIVDLKTGEVLFPRKIH